MVCTPLCGGRNGGKRKIEEKSGEESRLRKKEKEESGGAKKQNGYRVEKIQNRKDTEPFLSSGGESPRGSDDRSLCLFVVCTFDVYSALNAAIVM